MKQSCHCSYRIRSCRLRLFGIRIYKTFYRSSIINARLLRDLTLRASHNHYHKQNYSCRTAFRLHHFSRDLSFRALNFRGLSFRGARFHWFRLVWFRNYRNPSRFGFANYRNPSRFGFANYMNPTRFGFANYRNPSLFRFVSFRFPNYSKPTCRMSSKVRSKVNGK